MFRMLLISFCVAAAGLVQAGVAQDRDRDVDPELVLWWPLDELSGDTASDASGHRTHGILRGDPVWVLGIDDGALQLDGRDDYVAISGVYYGRSDNVGVTAAAWVRTLNENDQVIFTFDRNEYWRLEINGPAAEAGQIGWDIMTDVGQADLGSRTRIDDGQWHHVAGVFDQGHA